MKPGASLSQYRHNIQHNHITRLEEVIRTFIHK